MTIRQLIQKRWQDGAAWLWPALALSLGGLPAAAQDYTVATNTGAATILRYIGSGGAVSVPPVINGLPVTAVADAAFGFNRAVTSVTIPDSVTNLGQIVFISCTSLTNVTISASVAAIGELAFKNCINLAAITVDSNSPAFCTRDGVLFDKNQTTLEQYPQGKTGGAYAVPAGVQSIASGAFYGCTALTNVALPASLLKLGDAVFYGCTSLAVAALPEGVTNIGAQAFLNCQSLTEAFIPDSVVSLGAQAFLSCENLTNATVGNGVTGIGDSTFAGCSSLVNATVGGGATSIGNAAFEYCSALTTLELGGSLTNIGDAALGYCFNLSDITLPNRLAAIGSEAFLYCESLPSINIPASVTSLGDRTFEFCLGLTAITVDPANPAYAAVDGVLFDQRNARLIQYPVNNPRSSYGIPDGTLAVADTAFVSAYYLTSVMVPASVTSLESLAFYNCPEVASFFFRGAAPALAGDVFDLDTAATVYYLAGGANWGPTFGGLPTAVWNPVARLSLSGAAAPRAFGFTITGATNIPVVVEASTNLLGGTWTVVANIVLTNGQFDFTDPDAADYPGRYYRFRSP